MGIPRTPAELRVWAADEIQELETRSRNVARTTVDGRPPGTGRKMVCSESGDKGSEIPAMKSQVGDRDRDTDRDTDDGRECHV